MSLVQEPSDWYPVRLAWSLTVDGKNAERTSEVSQPTLCNCLRKKGLVIPVLPKLFWVP